MKTGARKTNVYVAAAVTVATTLMSPSGANGSLVHVQRGHQKTMEVSLKSSVRGQKHAGGTEIQFLAAPKNKIFMASVKFPDSIYSNGNFGIGTSIGYLSDTFTRDGIFGTVEPSYRIGRFKVIFDAGIYPYANTVSIGDKGSLAVDKHGVGLVFGLGGMYSLTGNLGVIAEEIRTYAGSGGTANTVMAGIDYSFGGREHGTDPQPQAGDPPSAGGAGRNSIFAGGGISVLNNELASRGRVSTAYTIGYARKVNSWLGVEASYINEGAKWIDNTNTSRSGIALQAMLSHNIGFGGVSVFIETGAYAYRYSPSSADGSEVHYGVAPIVGIMGAKVPIARDTDIMVKWERPIITSSGGCNYNIDGDIITADIQERFRMP